MDKAPTKTRAIFPVRFQSDLFDSRMASIIPISPDPLDDDEFSPSNLEKSKVKHFIVLLCQLLDNFSRELYGTTGDPTGKFGSHELTAMLSIH